MKKAATISLVLLVGFVAGRLTHQPRASAGPQRCAQENGDVNGDGTIDVSDVIALANFKFRRSCWLARESLKN